MSCSCKSFDNGAFTQMIGAMFSIPAMVCDSVRSHLGAAGCRCGKQRHTCDDARIPVANTDVKWLANEGETRLASILIENNRAHAATIILQAQPWTDDAGSLIRGGDLVLSPDRVTLKPGEAVTVAAKIIITKPLEAGRAYYTTIIMSGCPAKPITVGLMVRPAARPEFFALCDPCCGTQPNLLQFCKEPCCEPVSSHCGGSSCGDSSCGCQPCRPWPGCWDPHRHWIDDCDCDLIYLPRLPLDYLRRN